MHEISRRAFVKHSVLGASAALIGCRTQAPAARPSAADCVRLGQSGIAVPRLAMGMGTHGWKRASDQTRLGKEEYTRLVAHGVERGAAFIDGADLYGCHDFVRHALKSASIPREKVTILSKVWWQEAPEMTPAKEARPEVERFMKEMDVDRIDIALIHCVQDPEWPEKLKGLRDGLSELKREGIIRAVGCSCHSQAALAAAAEHPWADVILARINHQGAAMDPKGSVEEAVRVLKRARAMGKGVIGMKIFGCGKLTKPEERLKSLEFVLKQELVDAMTIGFTSPEQIDDVMLSMDGVLQG